METDENKTLTTAEILEERGISLDKVEHWPRAEELNINVGVVKNVEFGEKAKMTYLDHQGQESFLEYNPFEEADYKAGDIIMFRTPEEGQEPKITVAEVEDEEKERIKAKLERLQDKDN